MENKNTYKPGDWNAICDVCGFKFKASKLRRRWDGMRVCSSDFEERHPQDFLRVRHDDPSVPWVRNEGSIDRYVVVNPLDPDDVQYYESAEAIITEGLYAENPDGSAMLNPDGSQASNPE